jgi:hypothetical protein
MGLCGQQTRKEEMGGECGENRNACRVLAGKPEGNRPLQKRRHRCEDNITMNLKKQNGRAWT